MRRRVGISGVLVSLSLTLTPCCFGQGGAGAAPDEPRQFGIVAQPCPPPATLTPAARKLLTDLFMEPRSLGPDDFARLMSDADFKRFDDTNRRQARQDWAGLCRYRTANESVLQSRQPVRVVFMGDSITENWGLADPQFFEHDSVNRGVGGQTTPQMLIRFRADVIALKPQIVHILAGTNDVAGNTGPSAAQDVKNNIMSMVELARAHGIRVVLGSIPPAKTFNWQPRIDPVPQIRALNTWLREYAKQNQLTYVDYYAVLAGANGELKSALGNDGVHPNRDGYRIMRRLVAEALARPATVPPP